MQRNDHSNIKTIIMRKSSTLLLSLIISVFTFSSISAREKFTVSGDVFGKRVIIVNKGQFSNIVKDKPIRFAYDNFDEGVFFLDPKNHLV